jgi:hypothetical protein
MDNRELEEPKIHIQGDGNIIGDHNVVTVYKQEDGGRNHSPLACTDLPLRAYHEFVGRSQSLMQVMNVLRNPHQLPVVAVVGLGGIGKTALAREAVERCVQEDAFDHIVWTSAKTERFIGEDIVKTGCSDYSFEELLDEIGRQCCAPEITRLPWDEKRKASKELLAEKRVLIVIDNIETVPDCEILVNEVWQILGKGKLLITSRHQAKNEYVNTVDLTGLSRYEGLEFIKVEGAARNIEDVMKAQESSLIEICEVTGGAPLAMKLVIGQMSRLPMRRVISVLQEPRFAGQDYSFYRFVFRHSWDMLTFDSRKVLVSMSAFSPAIGGTEEAIQIVSRVEEADFHEALDELVLMSLLDPAGDLTDRRYTIHQLTNYFILSDIVKKWG